MIAQNLHCTVREAKERIKTSREFTDYCAFMRMFPYSYDTAFLACMISNMMRSKNSSPLMVGDFMPADMVRIDPEDKLWQTFHSIAERQNGANHGEH